MKTILILLALLNSLFAALVLAFSLSGSEMRQAAPLWLATKVVAGLAVVAIGALTWLAAGRPVNPSLTLLSSLFLVALGAATSVWTLHLALATGDMESYMVVYGGSLMAQGAFSIWSFLPGGRNTATMQQ